MGHPVQCVNQKCKYFCKETETLALPPSPSSWTGTASRTWRPRTLSPSTLPGCTASTSTETPGTAPAHSGRSGKTLFGRMHDLYRETDPSGQRLHFVDFDLGVPPCCLHAMPTLPDLQLLKQNKADIVSTKSKSTKCSRRPDKSPCSVNTLIVDLHQLIVNSSYIIDFQWFFL